MIYQVDNGADNGGKLPSGGVVSNSIAASSMSAVVATPITIYYGAGNSAIITQSGQSGDLYNYYWTSHSRGSDGGRKSEGNNPSWHNLYLDSYIPLRHKSIYDPCPYGYRIPSNGTYNEFTSTGWRALSYVGGVSWNQSWLTALGVRGYSTGLFSGAGSYFTLTVAIGYNIPWSYGLTYSFDSSTNRHEPQDKSTTMSVRCIEECEKK